MASSIKFKEIDPAHLDTLDTLKRRFHTTTNSARCRGCWMNT